MNNVRYVQIVGLIVVFLLLGGCLGSGGGGSGTGGVNATTGPVGYGTCTFIFNAQPVQCIAYIGSYYQSNVTFSSTGCSANLIATPSSCSLTNSVGICTRTMGSSGADASQATTYYSPGYTASAAQNECMLVGGTYTNP